MAVTVGFSGASALSVETTAGNLKSLVANPSDVTELALSGTVNAEDFKFIDETMKSLKTLDLSGVSILETECRIAGMSGAYPANTVPAYALAGSKIESVVFPSAGVFSLGDGAFAGSSLKTLVLPLNVANVGDGCFSGCANLESVTISNGALGIGAFAGCESLASVTVGLPTALPDNVFSNCTSLTEVAGSRNVTSIGERAFAGCSSLDGFVFGPDVVSIGKEAFICSGVKSVDMSGCVKLAEIGPWAFARMPRLTELLMPDGASISEGMVFGCTALATFRVSSSSTEVPDYAYSKNVSLDGKGIFNEEMTAVGRHSLDGMALVNTITLPKNLESIGDGAMRNMTGLKVINVVSETRPEIGSDVWEGVDQENVNLYVPDGQYGDYKSAEQWCNFNVLGVSASEDGVVDDAVENLKGRFVGDELQVMIGGVEMNRIAVYDVSGLLLVSAEPSTDFVAFDMSGFADRVFVVSAELSDGRVASLKIAKR